MNSWNAKLANCLELGTADASILGDLDTMLSWYSATSKEKDELRKSLINKYGDLELSVRFEEFLDRMVVSDAAVGEMFHPTLSADAAKKRYRQLIRIFHPDRGAKEEVWLNYRAERVNKAYKTYQQADPVVGQIDSVPTPAPKARAAGATGKQRPAVKFTYRPSIWRQRLGSAKDVQRKMIYGLIGVSSFLLLIFLAPSMQKERPAYTVVSEEELAQRRDIEPETAQTGQSMPELSQSSLNVLNDAKWLDEEVLTESDLDIELEREGERELETESTAQKILSKYEVAKRSVEAPKANPTKNEFTEFVAPEPVINEKISQQVPKKTNRQPDIAIATSLNETETKAESFQQPEKVEVKLAKSVCSEPGTRPSDTASKRPVELMFESFMRVGPGSDCRRLKYLSENTQLIRFECTPDGLWCFVQETGVGRAAQFGWVKANQLGPLTKSEKVEAEPVAKVVELKKETPKPGLSVPEVANLVPSPTVNTTPAPKEPELASERSLDSIVGEIFSSYEEYFESGDHEGMAGLFMSSARENKMRGIGAISSYYQRAFKTTYNRDFDIFQESLDSQDKSSAVVKGRLIVAADVNKSGKRNKIKATFRMVFLKVEGKYKIAVFEWKRA